MTPAEPIPSQAALEQAANWLARLHADDRTQQDEERFRAWLASSRENQIAFDAMDRSWSLLAAMPPLHRTKARPVLSRRLVMAGLGGGLAVGATFLALRPVTAKAYQTDVGEQRHIALDDGSKVFLNASTRLEVSIDESARRAELVYGRANFEIAPDKNLPFTIQAGPRKVMSHGASFDVSRDASGVQIVLLRGDAEVDKAAVTNAGKILSAGDRYWSDGNSVRLDRPRLAPLVAWQTRTAIFDNEPLSDAVREMNLYSPQSLEIADTRTAQLHVSGIFRVGNNAAFARSIAKFLPVQVSQQGERLVLHNPLNG